MKLCIITIKPEGAFGAPLKGDALFGQFCWQAAHDSDLLSGGLDRWVDEYDQRPFAVFSSAAPYYDQDGRDRYALKRPDLPLNFLLPPEKRSRKDRFDFGKEMKSRKWIEADADLKFDPIHPVYLTEKELLHKIAPDTEYQADAFIRRERRSRNSINRLTGTTGEAPFSPYAVDTFWYPPGAELAVFVLVDEEALDPERLEAGLQRIGDFGFGRDASTGLGRFCVTGAESCDPPSLSEANAMYTLAPSAPVKGAMVQSYYTPFVRFGRHGDRLAVSKNPFKNPVLMADEGAVFVPREFSAFEKPYLGRAIGNVSLADPRTVVQGYSPYIPIRLEASHAND